MDLKKLIEAKDVLCDYFGIVLPDIVLFDIINSDKELTEEIEDGNARDTFVRDLLIDTVSNYLKVKVMIPNVFGEVGLCDYPRFGDSDEYEEEFFKQFNRAVVDAGGNLL